MKRGYKNTNNKILENQKKKRVLVFGIRNKIIICFLVPIVFLILVGFISYQKAASGMISTFKESTQQTMNMARDYIDMSNSFVEAEALKYVVDEELSRYFVGLYQDEPSKKLALQNSQKTRILASQVGNKFISNIYLIPDKAQMISTKGKTQNGIYEEYMAEMKEAAGEGNTIGKWTDRHSALDQYLKVDETEYILSCQMEAKTGKAVIVIDVKADAIREFLMGLNLGEGSIVGFVTEGGKEIDCRSTDKDIDEAKGRENVFVDKDFYLRAEENSGSGEVTYEGKNYMFFHCRSEKTNASVCALVPMETVTGQAEAIKEMTIISVILASVTAMLVGVLIAAGIRKNMKRISRSLEEVAEGTLTAQVRVKGQDEFRILAGSANGMIKNTKKLVLKVRQASGKLEESAGEVTAASGVIKEYSADIKEAIDEINEGMERQSMHAHECVERTDSLSAEMQEVSRVARHVETLVSGAEEMIRRGMELVELLGERAGETTEVTMKVEESIGDLKQKLELINKFVSTITDISEQTNLLSLNASIEAARAGETGRGFAVVAEEIRKLADSSAEAAGEIRRNVEDITAQTSASVDQAKQAGNMVTLQTDAVKEVVEVFQYMNQSMQELFGGLKEIIVSSERADKERDETLLAVRNISEIISETAASAEIVGNVAKKLQKNVQSLDKTAGALGENMNDLAAEISVFRTE